MRQTYYKLRQPSDPKIVGVKDGGSQAEFIKDGFTNKDQYENIMNFRKPQFYGTMPSFEIDLEYVRMRKGSKLTDFVSYYPMIQGGNYLVSPHAVEILSTFKLPPHKFYPATIDHNGKIIHDYKLFYCPFLGYDYINFSKSLFYHGNSLLGKKIVQFNNAEEFVKAMSEEIVRPERLCVVKELDYTLDYIHFRASSEIFVSEELKETLEIAGLTGIKFVDAKEPELVFEE